MDWNTVIKEVLVALAPVIVSGMVAVIGYAIKFLIEKIRSTNNSTMLMLAGVAVRYAETQLGPDTTNGLNKQTLAVDFLCRQIKGLDRAVATNFVQAAYHAVFTDLAPLDQAVATSSGTPSASQVIAK